MPARSGQDFYAGAFECADRPGDGVSGWDCGGPARHPDEIRPTTKCFEIPRGAFARQTFAGMVAKGCFRPPNRHSAGDTDGADQGVKQEFRLKHLRISR